MMRRTSLRIAALLGTLAGAASGGAPAHAYTCPPDYRPHVGLGWAEGGTGFVPIGTAAVLFAMDGDCKYRVAVPPAELRVSVARKADGPFEPAKIEERGKAFAWRPRSPGLWFLRVDRTNDGRPQRAPGGAIVLAYEPDARVKAKVSLSLQGKLRDRVALLPAFETAAQPDCCDWLVPYLLLPRPSAKGMISARLPRGRYVAREGFVDRRSRTDDRQGALRRVTLLTTPAGQSGSLEVVADGDVALAMRAAERPAAQRAD